MSVANQELATEACRALAYSPRGAHLRCRLVSEHASDMLSVHGLDDEFTYLYASPASMRLFGYDPEELVGQSAFGFIHPDDCPAVEETAALLRERNDTGTATYRFRTKAGPYTWVESTCRLVPDRETGTPIEVIATTRSAETRVAAEAERARLLREADDARTAAEAANRIKDQFLAMMSHELRTPLNAISGHVEILQLGLHGPLTDAQRHALGRIDRAQRYLLRLVNDLLNMERLRTGKLAYDMQPVLVRELAQELESMLGPQLAAKSLTLAVEVADGVVATADREKLAQVLINLISNAIKFTPVGGSVTIDCPRRADGTQPDALCFIRVRDTGVVDAARECGARVIVVGTGRHNPIGRYVYGERALQIVSQADRPVIIVPREAVATSLSVAVVAVDFSPASVRAALAVLPLLAPGGRLVVVHVKPGVTLKEETAGWWNDVYERRCADLFAQFLRQLPQFPGVTLESKFLRGDIVPTVLGYAAAQRAGLIACGRLEHSLIERVLVGSVSSALVRQATLPVLVAPELPGDDAWR